MKCRSMKFLSTSFLHYFLYALCCLSLCLGFGSSSVNAEPALPTAAGHMSINSANFYEGHNGTYVSCREKVAQYMSCGLTGTSTSEQWLSGFDLNLGGTIPSSSYSVFTLQFSVGTYFNKFEFNGFVSNNNYEAVIVDQQLNQVGGRYTLQFTVYNYKPMQRISLRSATGGGIAIVFTTSASSAQINISSIDYVTVLSGTSLNNSLNTIDSDLKSILNNGIKATVDNSDVVSQIQQLQQQQKQDSQAQINAINNQTKQEQDQYEKDKQEEHDREESAKNDGNGLLGIFNITLLNPFAGIWEMFNSGGCTSIPTIAGWVGSEDTVYCSWWPQSIRATLTPVFSISSMVLLFGFFVRWLGGGEGIDVKGVHL